MLSYQTVNSHTLELLKKLTNEEFLSKARLVGGTALALQYGHRISIDLDFFGNIEEDNETIKERYQKQFQSLTNENEKLKQENESIEDIHT